MIRSPFVDDRVMNNEFNSQNNEKVINIAENHGDIIMSGKEPNNNDVKLDIKDVNNSELNINVVQGDKNTSTTQHVIWAGVAVVAIVGIVGIVLGLNAISKPTTENPSVNSSPNIVVSSTTNTQPTITPTNTNVIADKIVVKPTADRPKPTPSKIVSSKVVTQPKVTATPKKVVAIKREVKPKSDATPSDCSSTTEGCAK
jgi:outer membrane biosynthesis protein TonB